MMKKDKAETVATAVATGLTVVGTALVFTGLFLPYWVEMKHEQGIVVIRADIGIYQDRICVGDAGCDNFWIHDDDYDRIDQFKMPKEDIIKGFETAGCALAALSVLVVIAKWATHLMGSSKSIRHTVFTVYFTCVMIAGFFCEVGVLTLASEVDTDDSGYAPFLSGVGGALLFIAGTMSCTVCRYDPTYGTLENPVSPTFVQA